MKKSREESREIITRDLIISSILTLSSSSAQVNPRALFETVFNEELPQREEIKASEREQEGDHDTK
jgi:hypothetical protein